MRLASFISTGTRSHLLRIEPLSEDVEDAGFAIPSGEDQFTAELLLGGLAEIVEALKVELDILVEEVLLDSFKGVRPSVTRRSAQLKYYG